MKPVVLLFLATVSFTFCHFAEAGALRSTPLKKKIFFIGTGGTIAGVAADPTSPHFDPGTVTINAILDAVPDIKNLADISGEQLLDTVKMQELVASGATPDEAKKKSYVNICSCDIKENHWQLLAKRAEKALEEDGYDAVIITHGTDTIEESSFALQFLAHSQKPIIFVGAARPSNNPQADGPDNIRNAVRIAVSNEAAGRGVMVAMGGVIYPAFDITEVHSALATEPLQVKFLAPHFGNLGEVDANGRVIWNEKNLLLGTPLLKLKFQTQLGMPLPKVPILWQYAGNDSMDLIPMYEKLGLKAFVYAGFGLGSTPTPLKLLMKQKADERIDEVFVNASRTKGAVALLDMPVMSGVVNSGTLSPYHAKIFLQLVIQGIETKNPDMMAIIKSLPADATIREKIRAVWLELLYKQLGINPGV